MKTKHFKKGKSVMLCCRSATPIGVETGAQDAGPAFHKFVCSLLLVLQPQSCPFLLETVPPEHVYPPLFMHHMPLTTLPTYWAASSGDL